MSNASKKYSRVLTIAGTDSSGGAGIQADLKTFGALGCYGMTAITAVIAQNTCGVVALSAVDPELVIAQINSVLEDIGVDAIKVGALVNGNIVKAVAGLIRRHPEIPLVIDPVLFSKSGHHLLEDAALPELKALLPLSTLVTPNLAEASCLVGRTLRNGSDVEWAARQLLEKGVRAVLIKGGHLQEHLACDFFMQHDDEPRWFKGIYVPTLNTHGLGCTLSAAITAYLARGWSLVQAISEAKRYLQGAVEAGAAYTVGRGCGPVHHYWEQWS